MYNFTSLEELAIHFNFHHMRTLDGMRATNEALLQFYHLLNLFFDQFPKNQHIDIPILQKYIELMTIITQRINDAEHTYFLAKYQTEEQNQTPEFIKKMADCNRLLSFKMLPSRMQYWAAGNFFGDTIRFPEEHRKTVKQLQHWNNEVEAHAAALVLA